MAELRFEWDPDKAAANVAKHGITFEEAVTVFYDESAMLIDDPDHSYGEDRFLLLGISAKLRTIVVAHCHREAADVVRVISARKASRRERSTYMARWGK